MVHSKNRAIELRNEMYYKPQPTTINNQLQTMPRILAIDYGGKRTGLAVTDPMQIIATGLETIESRDLIPWLKKYLAAEQVELIIIGLPKNWDESDTHGTALVAAAIKKIQKEFPQMPVKTVDERYTSKMAKDAMLEMGVKKKDRRDKKNVDLIAATIILQEYLGRT
jgi:putative holliday junction resolvase